LLSSLGFSEAEIAELQERARATLKAVDKEDGDVYRGKKGQPAQ
jgi:hypothetical protein